jgi:hypothetical protein
MHREHDFPLRENYSFMRLERDVELFSIWSARKKEKEK